MLGFSSFPMARQAAPQSAAVESPFANWGGSPQAWQDDWQRRYDEEAAKYRPATGSRTQLVAGASGYDPVAAAPYMDEIYWRAMRGKFGDAAQEAAKYIPIDSPYLYQRPAQNSGDTPDFWSLQGLLSGYTPRAAAAGGSAVIQSPDYDPGYKPNFSALNAEKERLAPLAEQQMRQQQAYDWMEGAHQQNAIMSPDYANAGFNTITGMSNPYAGPGQIDGVSMDWAQGVYDPTTQRGTGTYNPTNYSKNTGW